METRGASARRVAGGRQPTYWMRSTRSSSLRFKRLQSVCQSNLQHYSGSPPQPRFTNTYQTAPTTPPSPLIILADSSSLETTVAQSPTPSHHLILTRSAATAQSPYNIYIPATTITHKNRPVRVSCRRHSFLILKVQDLHCSDHLGTTT